MILFTFRGCTAKTSLPHLIFINHFAVVRQLSCNIFRVATWITTTITITIITTSTIFISISVCFISCSLARPLFLRHPLLLHRIHTRCRVNRRGTDDSANYATITELHPKLFDNACRLVRRYIRSISVSDYEWVTFTVVKSDFCFLLVLSLSLSLSFAIRSRSLSLLFVLMLVASIMCRLESMCGAVVCEDNAVRKNIPSERKKNIVTLGSWQWKNTHSDSGSTSASSAQLNLSAHMQSVCKITWLYERTFERKEWEKTHKHTHTSAYMAFASAFFFLLLLRLRRRRRRRRRHSPCLYPAVKMNNFFLSPTTVLLLMRSSGNVK